MTETTTPPRRLQQEAFGRIFDAWADLEKDTQASRGRLTSLLEAFSGHSGNVAPLLAGDEDVDLATKGIWRVGPPIKKGSPVLFPVATASVWEKDSTLNACVRVALIASERTSPIRVWGWRFDSAEQSTDGRAVPRPHPHAQPITSWFMTNAPCLIHPHVETEKDEKCPWVQDADPTPKLNQTHPAFPLRGQTLPGLAMAFVVALHGVGLGRKIIDANPKVLGGAGEAIKDDVALVLGS